MIERHITFDVHPDRTGDFERFFADDVPTGDGDVARVRPGATSSARPTAPTRYQMVLRFADARERRRRGGPRRSTRALQPALEALHAGMEIQGYEVIA